MQRELIILSIHLNCPANKLNEARSTISMSNMPDDIKEKYHVAAFVFQTQGESRVECIFPKEPDEEVLSKINKLIDLQNKM